MGPDLGAAWRRAGIDRVMVAVLHVIALGAAAIGIVEVDGTGAVASTGALRWALIAVCRR